MLQDIPLPVRRCLPTRRRVLPRVALLGLTVALVITLSTTLFSASGLSDWGSFIASGQAANAGLNPYGVYDLTYRQVVDGQVQYGVNRNPPVLLPLFQLAALFDPYVTFRAWFGLSALLCLLSLSLVARTYPLSPLRLVWALALPALWNDLLAGQIYGLLLWVVTLAWTTRRRVLFSGVLLGLLCALKPNFLVWPALLFLAGHRRTSVAAGLTFGALNLAALAAYGPTVSAAWLGTVGLSAPSPFDASLLNLFWVLGSREVGAASAGLLLLGLAGWSLRSRPDWETVSGAALAAALLASPIAWLGYTLVLVPVLWSRPRWTGWTLAAAVLLVLPVPVDFMLPGLWAALRVALLCLLIPSRPQNSAPDSPAAA